MDFETESKRARIKQFKQDRWPYVIGHFGASAAVIGIAWSVADHGGLFWFAVTHHIASWIIALSLFLPLRRKDITQLPLWTYVGVVIGNATLSSALLFDLTAAQELPFTLTVGVVLFAGAAGSFVTLGIHPTILRVALTSLLLPFVITTLCLGHVAAGLGTMFFYGNVVVAGVWKLANGQQELIALRIEAAHRAEIAEQEAGTDHLTGLVNRRGLWQFEGMELAAGATALYFDLNKFKTINDTHGHDAGDEILQTTASRLRGSVSASDVVARLGGDEFLVLVFSDDLHTIDTVVDRICERLQEPISLSGGQVLSISAAVGGASTSGEILELDDLLRDSDRAMYRAKVGPVRVEIPEFAS